MGCIIYHQRTAWVNLLRMFLDTNLSEQPQGNSSCLCLPLPQLEGLSKQYFCTNQDGWSPQEHQNCRFGFYLVILLMKNEWQEQRACRAIQHSIPCSFPQPQTTGECQQPPTLHPFHLSYFPLFLFRLSLPISPFPKAATTTTDSGKKIQKHFKELSPVWQSWFRHYTQNSLYFFWESLRHFLPCVIAGRFLSVLWKFLKMSSCLGNSFQPFSVPVWTMEMGFSDLFLQPDLCYWDISLIWMKIVLIINKYQMDKKGWVLSDPTPDKWTTIPPISWFLNHLEYLNFSKPCRQKFLSVLLNFALAVLQLSFHDIRAESLGIISHHTHPWSHFNCKAL